MQEPDLDRIREDLSAMQEVIGDVGYGTIDARFFAGESFAAVILALCLALGADAGWPLFLSGLPLILVSVIHLGFVAAKSRDASDVSAAQRKDYRKSLLIIVPAALVALAARKWAFQAGMSYLQFGGAIGVVTGCAFVLMSATNSTHGRYPQWMWHCLGLPLIVCGLIVPFCTKTQAWITLSVTGAVVAALFAFLIHRDLVQEHNRTPHAAD